MHTLRFIVRTQAQQQAPTPQSKLSGPLAPPEPPTPPAARASAEDEAAETQVPPPLPETPTEAFDQLYELHARELTRQAFLLCGHRRVAERAVNWAFHRAWEHWPEVAADNDPGGWVRAAAYEYALSPWHQFLPGRRHPEAYAGPPEDRVLLDAVLRLPRPYRAALLLYDGLGLSLPDTAAETEASTGATAGRITHAREALAQGWRELREAPEEKRRPLLAARLRELAAAQPVRTTPPHLVRRGSEHTTRRWTRASVGLTATVTAATVFTLLTAENPAPAPPEKPRSRPSVPPAPSGSGLVPERARPSVPTVPAAPPPGRSGQTLPGPGDPVTTTHAYLPQLRSTNARTHLKDFKDFKDFKVTETKGFRDREDHEADAGHAEHANHSADEEEHGDHSGYSAGEDHEDHDSHGEHGERYGDRER